MTATDPLQHLKDIHLPPPVSWWPPAPGWWLLAVVVILAILLPALWLWRKHRRNRWLRLAQKELQRLETRAAPTPEFFSELNALLKRAARLRYPADATDTLSGEAWIGFLQTRAPRLSDNALRQLAESCWHPEPSLPLQDGLHLAGDWLRAQKC